MKVILYLLVGFILLTGGFFFGKQQAFIQSSNSTPSTIVISSIPTPQATALPVDTPVVTLNTTSSTTTNINTNTLPVAGGGPQNDIIEITQITASQPIAQIGDDVSFSVTIKNQASYKKFIQGICFNSSDATFGCVAGKNLAPGEMFNINDSGRFHSSGVKSVWITWTQDNVNYFRPINAGTARVTIQ